MTSIVLACVAIVLALPAVGSAPQTATADGRPRSTHHAVPWRATDIEGRAWSSDALQGRVVLVDFWATWCAPCLEELPRLKRLHEREGPRGLTIIGVSLDRATTRDFRSWLQRQAITWPQVRESGQYESPLARTFGVEAIPASYLFDRDGRLHATSLRGEALETRVSALVEAR